MTNRLSGSARYRANSWPYDCSRSRVRDPTRIGTTVNCPRRLRTTYGIRWTWIILTICLLINTSWHPEQKKLNIKRNKIKTWSDRKSNNHQEQCRHLANTMDLTQLPYIYIRKLTDQDKNPTTSFLGHAPPLHKIHPNLFKAFWQI